MLPGSLQTALLVAWAMRSCFKLHVLRHMDASIGAAMLELLTNSSRCACVVQEGETYLKAPNGAGKGIPRKLCYSWGCHICRMADGWAARHPLEAASVSVPRSALSVQAEPLSVGLAFGERLGGGGHVPHGRPSCASPSCCIALLLWIP